MLRAVRMSSARGQGIGGCEVVAVEVDDDVLEGV